MELQVYSVFDKKTTVYGRPFYAHNDGHAVRCVLDELSRDDSQLSRYPEDFALYRVGVYCDTDGSLIGCNPVVVVEVAALRDSLKKGV